MQEQTYTVACPQCGKKVEYKASDIKPPFPFCSVRCKMVDLGKWMNEEHRIESPASEQANGTNAPDAKNEAN